jgi:hypothetical protein
VWVFCVPISCTNCEWLSSNYCHQCHKWVLISKKGVEALRPFAPVKNLRIQRVKEQMGKLLNYSPKI